MVVSKTMEQFLNLCNEAGQKYNFYNEIVETCNKRTTDYLHSLELDNLTYKERNKLQTEELKNLKERREAKDITEVLEPLMEYLKTQEGKKANNMLQQVLGKVRKIEKYHENRTYKKRIKDNDG